MQLFITHHYGGTTAPEVAWERFMRANDRAVSPNYQINADGTVWEVVPPRHYRAWTTGGIDHFAVTCETQNTSGEPSWGISRASHEAIARLFLWTHQTFGVPLQRGHVADGNRIVTPGIVGHNETPAGRETGTLCPGPSMDIDWIIARARQLVEKGGLVPRYPNGEAPLDVLVSRPSASKDFCLMFPGTAVKYDRLVQLGRARYGWTPLVSGPDDAYRRLSVQIEYKRIYGGNAAAPGYSSHGGWFEGAETGALDIGNWGDIGQDAFYQLASDAGFVPGYFDWEPWHIIDYTPWDVPARPAPVTVPEEDDMLALKIGIGGTWHLCTLGLGVFRHLISSDDPERIKNIIRADDKWLETDGNELPKLLQTYGCDLNIWDVRNGAFVVYDPRDGSVRSGNMWAAWNVNRNKPQTVVKSAATAAYEKALSAA
ncbi:MULTISPECIES: N-acetylmuramoyl-L-alanine amidase [unclassified Microbacterium]|uniref:N-acetylmuramoyl-L-alanine amidase n=1 Tax=unclassified Microbacterium TaxID=2609290 RepID=UPI00300FD40B